MSTKLIVGNQLGIPSLYSLVSFSTRRSSLKNRLVFFSFFIIFLDAFLKRSARFFCCLIVPGESLVVCVRTKVCFLCRRRLCSTWGAFILVSLVNANASCCRLSCLILWSSVRASDGITTIAIITNTEVAIKSFLGKPETIIHYILNYIRWQLYLFWT